MKTSSAQGRARFLSGFLRRITLGKWRGRCFGCECCWNALQISARRPAAFTTAKRLLTCWLLTVVVPANVFPTHNVTRISKFPEAEKSASSDFPMEFPSMARHNHIECSTNKMKSPRIMSEFLSESII
jgi:hypothetical protein